jgi:hypothetical protein
MLFFPDLWTPWVALNILWWNITWQPLEDIPRVWFNFVKYIVMNSKLGFVVRGGLTAPAGYVRPKILFSTCIYLWRPRFFISIISANDRISQVKHCWHWSNLGQPGTSLREPRQQSLMTHLIKSTPTCDQPWSKARSKPRSNPLPLSVL